MDIGIDEYLTGKRLMGDDMGGAEAAQWVKDEREAYAGLVGSVDRYAYHGLNRRHGFHLMPGGRFRNVLGFGSADGQELEPIIGRLDAITIVEPSDSFVTDRIMTVPVRYVKPATDGRLPFRDGAFDLVLSLGALHHIPNVSRVVGELFRCMSAGGHALVREPIVSLGDWRKPRKGLTKRERGIPLELFRGIISKAGFTVVSERLCMFPLTGRLGPILGKSAYNSRLALSIDDILCRLFAWNVNYHPRNLIDKLRPTSVFYVLRKD